MRPLEIFKHLYVSEIKMIWLNKSYLLNSLVFYILCIALFNISIGPFQLAEPVKIALLYTPLVLSMMLSSSMLYERDFRSGLIQQLSLLPVSFEYVILAKFCAYCSAFIISLICIIPLSCLILGLPYLELPNMMAIGALLVLLTASIMFLSNSIIVSTSLNSVIPILVLPLLIPGLILATFAVNNSQYLWLLLAIVLLNLPISLYFTRLSLINSLKYDA